MGFAWSPITQTDKNNLITNGTMEVDANWSNANTPTVNVRSSTRSIEYTYSRLFTVDAQYDGIVSDAFTTSSNTRYLVSFWVYPDDNQSIRTAIYNGSSYPIVWEYNMLTQDAWNQVMYIHRQVTGSSACVIYFQSITGVSSGSYYIDDVRVTPLESPVPTTNLVTNGTMEADSNWTTSGTPTVNERSTTQVHGGTYSRKVTVDAIYEGIAGDTFTTVTQEIYYVSFWVYPDDSTDVYFGIRNGANTAWNTVFTAKTLTQDAWNQVEFYYQEKAGGSGAYIVFQSSPTGSGTGTWYYDDVVIAATPRGELRGVYLNEILSSVTHLATQLGISEYGWTELGVVNDQTVTAAQINEAMTALNYIDTNNTCVSHNVTANSGENTGQDVAIHTGKDVSVLSGQDVAIHTGKDVSVLSGQDAAIHSGKDVAIHSSKDVTVHTSVQTTHYNDHNTVRNDPYNSGVLGTQYVSNLSSRWTSAQIGADGVVNTAA